MSLDEATELIRQTLMMALVVSAPMLVIGLVVGIIVSLLQAVTQIQEQSLSFIPKIAAMVASAILLMPWISHRLVEYSAVMFSLKPQLFVGIRMLESALQFVPVFVLVVFRLAGMALFAPLFGSAKIPRRVRGMLILILALGMTPAVARPPVLPSTPWALAIGIGGEIAFGLAMGTIMSFVFIACQWAGEIIGQQMGFNLSEVFDPSFGAQGSLIGDAYFMLTLVVFLVIGGHRAMLQGVYASFKILPLLSLGIDESLLHLLAGLLMSATILAIQLAAPMLVATLVVDLVLGLIGKTMPQMNVMSTGLTLRAVVGMLVVFIGLGLTVHVISDALLDSMMKMWDGWTGIITPP